MWSIGEGPLARRNEGDLKASRPKKKGEGGFEPRRARERGRGRTKGKYKLVKKIVLRGSFHTGRGWAEPQEDKKSYTIGGGELGRKDRRPGNVPIMADEDYLS